MKQLDINRNNNKRLWEILNSVIKRGTGQKNYPKYFICNDHEEYNMDVVANSLNEFFVTAGPNLARTITDPGKAQEKPDTLIDRNPYSMFLTAVDENEVFEIVKKCKNQKSLDCNDIDMIVVKRVIEAIIKPFTYICNLSLQTGRFPDRMKIAKVIPLYKSGNKHHFTNYRPVSLLPQFSKILEKLFNNRLEKFIDKHKLLTESQYGFRSSRSTSLALLDSIECITNSIDKKQYVAGLFIDLSKAFDTIDHDILIRKLERYGVRGVALDWVRSYLGDRKQFVKLNGGCSLCMDIACGVPQGSVLGPKFFNLYINDICKVSKVLKMVLFADDTNIFCSGDDLQNLLEDMTNEISKVKFWLDKNKLSLNLNKSKLMLF